MELNQLYIQSTKVRRELERLTQLYRTIEQEIYNAEAEKKKTDAVKDKTEKNEEKSK